MCEGNHFRFIEERYKKYRRLPTFLGTISYPELRYNITHPNGENETIIENKTFYSKKQLNNKLHIGDILEIVVTKIGINFCEVYSEKKNVYAYIPCKEPAYMYKEGHRFFVKITGYNSNKDMYIVKECDHK